MSAQPAYVNRKAAAAYISNNYFPCAVATLASLAVRGGGPAFRKAGPYVLYEPRHLDQWAAEQIGPLVSTTTEAGVAYIEGRGRPRKTKPLRPPLFRPCEQ
jgi:hypothetical protein